MTPDVVPEVSDSELIAWLRATYPEEYTELLALVGSKPANLQRTLHAETLTSRWDPTQSNTFAEEIAHLHEEVSEAFRAWREYGDAEVRYDANGKPLGVPVELADVLIGMLYIAERWGFSLLKAMATKRAYNRIRDYEAEGRVP